MRLQLTLVLVAVACAPPNAGITFAEPESSTSGIPAVTSEGGDISTIDPPSTLSDGESEDSIDPATTSGSSESGNAEDSTEGGDSTTGIPLPDPVTMIEWTFGTQTYAGQFAPRNIVAAWIENDQGTFVRTLIMLSVIEKVHLVEWNLVTGGNTLDAITGATPQTHGTVHSGIWDLRDVNGQLVPDGNYVLRIEMTEDNSAGVPPEGPVEDIAFTLGTGHFDLQPPDGEGFHSLRAYGHD